MFPDAPDENTDPLGSRTADIRERAGGCEGAEQKGNHGRDTRERRSQDGDRGGTAMATNREPRRYCYESQEKTTGFSKEMMV